MTEPTPKSTPTPTPTSGPSPEAVARWLIAQRWFVRQAGPGPSPGDGDDPDHPPGLELTTPVVVTRPLKAGVVAGPVKKLLVINSFRVPL